MIADLYIVFLLIGEDKAVYGTYRTVEQCQAAGIKLSKEFVDDGVVPPKMMCSSGLPEKGFKDPPVRESLRGSGYES